LRFSEQVAIVTAAAGAGIGQATARALAAEGASVVVSDQHARRTAEVAAAIAAERHVPTLGVVCDVTNRAQIDEMVKMTLDRFGRIDMLVNNAGFDLFQPLAEMDAATIDRVVSICLMGTIFATKAVLPAMMKQKRGRIVNLSSISAYTPDAGDSAAYCAAKAGVAAFTRTFAREVGQYGIRVNAVAPGVTPNPFFEKQMPPEIMAEMARKMPLGLIKPENIAKAILFLLSEDSASTSGATLNVTGGW